MTDYIVATSSVVPVRRAPTEAAEMVNQLLLGETARVTSAPDHLWTPIEGTIDGYPGFVSSNMVAERDPAWPIETDTGKNSAVRLRSRWSVLKIDREQWMVPMGIRLLKKSADTYLLPDGRSGFCIDRKSVWLAEGLEPDEDEPLGIRMMRVAADLAGTPYLWAGKSSFGIDCSGLIQLCGFLCGAVLPRDAYMQFRTGEEIEPSIEKLEPGDLLFFEYPWGETKINHVAFYAGNGRILHASGRVRWNSLNEKDIDFSRKHLDSLTGARRLSRAQKTTEVGSSGD